MLCENLISNKLIQNWHLSIYKVRLVLEDQEEFRNTEIQILTFRAILKFKVRKDDVEQVVTCGQGGVPDEGHRVPEHEGGVDPGLGGVHVVGPVLALAHLHLHELGDVLFIDFSL